MKDKNGTTIKDRSTEQFRALLRIEENIVKKFQKDESQIEKMLEVEITA